MSWNQKGYFMIILDVLYLGNYVSSTFILCLSSQGITFATT